MKILIGGQAMNALGVHFDTSDHDYFYLEGDEKPQGDSHSLPQWLFDLLVCECTVIDENTLLPSLNALYTIKSSHLEWDIFWLKHAIDCVMLERHGATRIEALYISFKKFWKETHGYKTRLSLDRTKDDFFNDAVVKKYDHDWLHEVVASPRPPLYTLALSDNAEVMIDRAKFEKLEKNQQLNMFREEMCVIALERWVIPSEGKIHPALAYIYAVNKTVTNLTKNWASQFILDNLTWYLTNFDRTFFVNYIKSTMGVEPRNDPPSYFSRKLVKETGTYLKEQVCEVDSSFFKTYSLRDRYNYSISPECDKWSMLVKPVTKTVSIYEEVK